jgi:hypothetical protein
MEIFASAIEVAKAEHATRKGVSYPPSENGN